MTRPTRTPAVLAALGLGLGCGGAPPSPAPPAPVATTLQIAPSPLVLAEHQTARLVATVLDQTWARMDLPILWQSSDPAVAAVTDSAGVGVVTAVGAGTALVSARAHNQLATVMVRVVERLAVDVYQSGAGPDPAGFGELAAGNAANCFYELTAVASGGAPGDSAVFEPSQVEFVDPDRILKVDTLDATEMLDRFGRLVLRSGDTLRTRRLVATPVAGARVVHRIRYAIGAESRSTTVTIGCSRSATSSR